MKRFISAVLAGAILVVSASVIALSILSVYKFIARDVPADNSIETTALARR